MREPRSHARRRVLHVVSRLGLGGAEVVASDIIAGLTDGYTGAMFAVVAGVHDEIGVALETRMAQAGVPLRVGTRTRLKQGGLLIAAWNLSRMVRSLRPDVLHVHTEIPEAAFALACRFDPSLASIPLVRTIHNSTLWPRWRTLAHVTERSLTSAYVAAVSDAALDGLDRLRASMALPRVARDRVRRIYNGRSAPSRERRGSAGRGDRLRVLFAGRFELEKGADLLPSVFRSLSPSDAARIDLTVAGSGHLQPQLRTGLAELSNLGSVTLSEPVPGLAERLADFDLVVMPSRFEGLPLIAIEAALAGVTVVASRAPGLDEALPPEHPWLADVGDAGAFAQALTRALREPDRWPTVNATAEAFARERFDLGAMQRAYVDLYDEVLGPRRARAHLSQDAEGPRPGCRSALAERP